MGIFCTTRHPGNDPVERVEGVHPLREEVPGLEEGVHPLGEEVPGLEEGGERGSSVVLGQVDQDDQKEQHEHWNDDDEKNCLPQHGHGEDEGRHDEEHEHEIEDGEPAVLGGGAAQDLAHD